MSNIWFTSDWHLKHKRVITFENNIRGKVLEVETIEEHDAHIYGMVVGTVCKRDILYVMGDNGDEQATYDLLKDCQAQEIRFLPGNHDRASGIAMLATLPNLKVWPPATYKQHWLTHQPMHPVELWGRKNIHGHVHSKSLPDENYINVSVEAAGINVLVNFDDIKSGAYTTHGL